MSWCCDTGGPRFRDDGRSSFDYLDEILVTCPKCGAAGWVAPMGTSPARPRAHWFTPRQFRCFRRHHRAEHRGGTLVLGTDACDPYLRLPAWVKVCTNRAEVLRAIARVRARLSELTGGRGKVSPDARTGTASLSPMHGHPMVCYG